MKATIRLQRVLLLMVAMLGGLSGYSQEVQCEVSHFEGQGVFYGSAENELSSDAMTKCVYEMMSKPEGDFDIDHLIFTLSYSGQVGNAARQIIRQYKGKNVNARFYFDDGKYTTYSVRVEDKTSDDWKKMNNGLADLYMTFSPLGANSKTGDEMFDALIKLTTKNITKITVGNLSIDFKSKGFKSKYYYNPLYVKMGDAGALGQKVQASDSASSSGSAGASYTVNTNLTLREMLAKPMGCVNADLLNDSFNTIKSNTKRGFQVNDSSKDGRQIFYVWDSHNTICESMTYHGLPFSNFRFELGKYGRNIKYQFDFKKNIDAYRALDMIAQDFKSMGIPMTYERRTDNFTKAYGTTTVNGIIYTINLEDYSPQWSIYIYMEKWIQ